MDLCSQMTPWTIAAGAQRGASHKVKCVILGAKVGAASLGGGPGKDTATALWPASPEAALG